MKRWLSLLSLPLLVLASALRAEPGLSIAIIGKTKNDSFYEQSYRGCQAFAQTRSDLRCVYDGPADFQDIRGQVDVLNRILEAGINGVLISVTDSHFLAEQALRRAKAEGVPVITFDSDLLPADQQYRLAYVGTNNFDYGVALGNYAKRFKRTDEVQICIQSGHDTTPNLNERIRGVRYALSGNSQNLRLRGENGWVEPARCPFYSLGKRSAALFQLEYILQNQPSTIFLAVAGFAQFSPLYIEHISPYREQIRTQRTVIISADTETVQLQALAQHLSTVNIGQQPYEMGRLGAELIYQYLSKGQRPERDQYYLDFHYCTPENVERCTQQ